MSFCRARTPWHRGHSPQAHTRVCATPGVIKTHRHSSGSNCEIALPEIELPIRSMSSHRLDRNSNVSERFVRIDRGLTRAGVEFLDCDLACPTRTNNGSRGIERNQHCRQVGRCYGLATMTVDCGVVETVIAQDCIAGSKPAFALVA